jgi:phosphoglycolate phosphatase-like HAD superfamily hydrolase
VLFDFDGTIIDTMQVYAQIAAGLISRELGIDMSEAARRYLSLSGRPFREQLLLLGIDPGKVEKLARIFEEKKLPILLRVEPDEVTKYRLRLLRSAGLKLALSTNNECRLVRRLKWAYDLFDIVLCHDPEKGLAKGLPHLKELEMRGFRSCEIIFVGDSDYDLEVYRPYGVSVVKTSGLWRREDKAVEEILSLLRSNACSTHADNYDSKQHSNRSRS